MKKIVIFICMMIFVLSLAACEVAVDTKTEIETGTPVRPISLPVIMYHDFTDGDKAPHSYAVNIETFDEQMAALKAAGYTSITPHQLDDFLNGNTDIMPEKPIMITMDDGYSSNIQLAAPVLEKHGFCATVFVVGESVGKDGALSHFSYDEAKPFVERGVIDVQSHTHAMHKKEPRRGVLAKEGESDNEYRAALKNDIRLSVDAIEDNLDTDVVSMAFPYGKHSEQAAEVFSEHGVRLLFTTEYGCNYVAPVSEYEAIYLKRIPINEWTKPASIVNKLNELLK